MAQTIPRSQRKHYFCPFIKREKRYGPEKCIEDSCQVWDTTNLQCSLRM